MKTSHARQLPDGRIQFEYWEYELLSFQLTDKYAAIFIMDPGRVVKKPLDALGLAKVTTHYRQREKGGVLSTATREPTSENKLVGLFLSEHGTWVIANDRAFFLGICPANATDERVHEVTMRYLRDRQAEDDGGGE